MAVFKFNMQRNLDMTAGNNIFMDVPKDGSVRVRLVPPVKANGELSFLTQNHFRLKREDGEGGTAIACNARHNPTEPCFLCALAAYLKGSNDPIEQRIGDGRESIKANKSYYLQVLPSIHEEDGSFTYGDPKFLRLPKSGIDNLNELFGMQRDASEDLAVDPEKGRDIVVRRKDTGENFTKYSVMAAGAPVSLDKIKPGWEKIIMSEEGVLAKLDLKIQTAEEQIATATRSYPSLDWKQIEEDLGDD